MALRLPPYQPLPAPRPGGELLEVPIAQLRPTQLCVGLAEVRSRLRDFGAENARERRSYLGSKPVPLVRSADGSVWMVDRHHRLRALIEIEPGATAFGYVVLELDSPDPQQVLAAPQRPARAAHRPAGRPLPQLGVEAEAGGGAGRRPTDSLPRIPLGGLAAQPPPAALQLRATRAGPAPRPRSGPLPRRCPPGWLEGLRQLLGGASC